VCERVRRRHDVGPDWTLGRRGHAVVNLLDVEKVGWWGFLAMVVVGLVNKVG
jgi:hypothetical protein